MMISLPCTDKGMLRAQHAVKSGAVIIYPTDTVYGIGCDPYNAGAVKKILGAKGRDPSKPMPVLGTPEKLANICELDGRAKKLADAFWPGQLTIVARLTDEKLRHSMMLNNTIAVRAPSGKCISSLLDACGLLVGTSANISGQPPITDSAQCHNLQGADYMIDGGKIPNAGQSTIIDATKPMPAIIREGQIPESEVRHIL